MNSMKKVITNINATFLALFVLMGVTACLPDSMDQVNPTTQNPQNPEETEVTNPMLILAKSTIDDVIATNTKCNSIGDFYWVIGDETGKLLDGKKGVTFNEDSRVPIFSASKMVFGAYVLEKIQGKNNLTDALERGLNFTSGQVDPANAFCNPADTVSSCYTKSYKNSFSQADFNNRTFRYGSGHMQSIASDLQLGIADKTIATLGGTINSILNFDSELSYISGFTIKLGPLPLTQKTGPLLAAGIQTNAKSYEKFLTQIVDGTHQYFKDALGHKSVYTTNCSGDHCLMYSMGHWVENDFDGAYSSMGAMGFYPWISKSKTYWGIVVRHDNIVVAGQDNAKESQVCGQQIRKSFLELLESSTYESP